MFNYRCTECRKGTVREQIKDFEANFSGARFLVKDARLGVCDHCGAENFDASEYKRWVKMFEKSLEERQKPLSPAAIKKVRTELGLNQRQFAVLLGCTRQSIYNWENPKRRVPVSRQGQLMIRLLSVPAARAFLFESAKEAGYELPQTSSSESDLPGREGQNSGTLTRHPTLAREEFSELQRKLEKTFGSTTRKPAGFSPKRIYGAVNR